MSPHPIYWWKSFWLRLLLLGGIVWTSADSRKWMSAAYHAGRSGGASVTRDRGYTYVEWGPLHSPVAQGWHFLRRRADKEEVDWPQALSTSRMIGREVFRIPDKPVIAFLSICWCGWIGWRLKQKAG